MIYIQNIEEEVQKIDLSRHGIIEASAGTGKTYAITRLIQEILETRKARIHEILALTYTKKAAQELKDRIRSRLEKRFKETKNPEIQNALKEFHRFTVGTIHSFCQQMLKEYPFETRAGFHFDLGEEGELLETAFMSHLKNLNENPASFKQSDLPIFQALSLLRKKNQILGAASAYDTENPQQFRPNPEPLNPEDRLFVDYQEGDEESFFPYFVIPAIQEIFFRAEELKKKLSLVTYNDLLRKVSLAVRKSSFFLATLRERYQVALIDEFQDTDPQQWEIFKTVFVDSEKHLFLAVGDPKQAIYSFRGADLNTFFEAKNYLLSKTGILYFLTANWRSSKALLNAFQNVFQKNWFNHPGILYPPLSSSNSEKSEETPVTLVHLESESNKESDSDEKLKISLFEAQKQFAQFTAKEILSLRESGFQDQEILILVRKSKEAKPIQKALKEQKIPFVFYKESGLFQTPEARQLAILLESLSDLNRKNLKKALLTRFFDLKPEILDLLEENSEILQNYTAIFEKWQELAFQRKWTSLVFSLFYETGLLSREKNPRQNTNWVQLGQRLLLLALNEKGGIHHLYRRFFSLVKGQNRKEEDFDRLALETEKPAVRIMTLHASKGLEASIVFIAGGFSAGQSNEFYQYSENHRKIIDLEKNGAGKEIQKSETAEEERRLFYVGFTRAKERLYIPWIPNGKAIGGFLGEAETLTLFENWQESCLEVKKLTPDAFLKTPETANEQTVLGDLIPLSSPLKSIPSLNLTNSWVQEFSYSSLKQEHSHPEGFEETEKHFLPLLKFSSENLPGGPATGLLVHEILEKLDYTRLQKPWLSQPELCQQEFEPLVRKHLKKPLSFVQYETLRDLIANALTIPLFKNSDFSLKDLRQEDTLRETDFLASSHIFSLSDLPPGFAGGVIDLIFRYENRIYLLDWKTDLLTQTQWKNLKETTLQRYGIQQTLYAETLKKILPKDTYGGMFYLFLRYLNSETDSGKIFFSPGKGEFHE